MKNSKSMVALLLSAAMLLTACGQTPASSAPQSSTTGNGAQSTPAAPEKRDDIVWLTTGDGAAKPITENDRIVAAINEKLNINLIMKIVPESDVTKVNVAMASGDLPDIVTGANGASATNQWIKDGLLLPMNDYLPSNPNLNNLLVTDYPWSAVDGKYYGLPFVSLYKVSNQTISFRQDWLDKLGLKVPENLDEFYTTLKAFAENDPDGNQKKDTYGITSSGAVGNFDFIFYAYGRPYADFALNDKGEVIPWFEHESFALGMQYLRKLWDEKLIDPEFMLNSKEKMEEKFYQSKAGFMTTYLFRHVNRLEGNLKKLVPEGKLGYSLPPKGPNNDFGYSGANKDGLFTAVTVNCKAPDKAMALIDFLVSKEGEELVRLGIEGVHYTKDGDKILYNEAEREKDSFAANGWCHPLAWGSLAWPIDAMYLPETEPDRDRAVESAKLAGESIKPNLVKSKPNAQVEYGKMVEDVYNQYFIDMLTGKLSLETGIPELSQKWRSQHGDEILAEANALYQAQQG